MPVLSSAQNLPTLYVVCVCVFLYMLREVKILPFTIQSPSDLCSTEILKKEKKKEKKEKKTCKGVLPSALKQTGFTPGQKGKQCASMRRNNACSISCETGIKLLRK